MKKDIIFIIFLFVFCSLSNSKISCADGLMSFAKSIGSASFWENMGSSFGMPPFGYSYSFEVISDASVDIYVAQEGMASFMGASFPSAKGLYGKKTLPSIFNITSGPSVKASYTGANYYFNMYISDKSDVKKSPVFSQAFTTLPFTKKDPNIYYYHAYTGKKYSKGNIVHYPQVEMLGFQNPLGKGDAKGNVDIGGQLFSIVFYNSMNNDAQVQLNYGPVPMTFTLEKNSYNTLNVPIKTDKSGASAPSFSLRPNTLSFSAYNITSKKYDHVKDLLLPSDGFNGCTYTIEIFDDGQGPDLCIQGLAPGNYDQMISSKVRDLTPCSCVFWYKSVAQSPVGDGFVDLPGQVWIAYKGTDSLIISKVDLGKVVSWNLIRPCLSQHDQYVYFVYVATSDDVKAKKFVEQVITKGLSADQMSAYQAKAKSVKASNSSKNATTTTTTTTQQSATVTGVLSSTTGLIQGAAQDIYGYIIGIDIFTSKGLGDGNFYYVLSPLVVNSGSLVQLLSGCIDTSKLPGSKSNDDIQKILSGVIINWLHDYLNNPKDIADQVQNYLIKYGNSFILDAKGALTDYGKKQVTSIVQGPMSLKYPPMKLSTVLNQYVYDFGKSVPDKLPDDITPLVPVAQL